MQPNDIDLCSRRRQMVTHLLCVRSIIVMHDISQQEILLLHSLSKRCNGLSLLCLMAGNEY